MAAFFLSPSSLSLLPNPLSSLSSLSLSPLPTHRRLCLPLPLPSPPLTIRGGGGPRTFPGGLTKLQWKRMQAKKSKQLFKARLLRDRQLYDARKRSELKAAFAHLEKPWEELAERRAAATTLFSAGADDQVRALADRFQRPGGFDTWSDSDGPRVFRRIAGGELPTARFFPKGAVHSVRPYGVGEPEVFDDWIARGESRRRKRRARRPRSGTTEEEEGEEGVRPNACVEGNGRSGSTRNDDGIALRPTADVVHVEAVDRTEGVRWNSSERADGKAAGGERYGMINWWHGGKKSDSDSDSATLRLTPDIVDLEAVDRKEAVGWNSSERADGKAAGGDRYGMINRWHRGKKNDSGRSGSMRNDGISPATDVADVEVVDRKEGVRWNSSERTDGKAAGRERYGMINRWHSGKKNVSDSSTLRPTTDIVDLEVVGGKEGLGWRWNSSERADGKAAGGERYGMINWWDSELATHWEEESVTLDQVGSEEKSAVLSGALGSVDRRGTTGEVNE